MKIITGHQPTYLPWLGLFHKISLADQFVFMDDVQYLRQDWNNRNKIKGTHGSFWLTVPVSLRASSTMLLKDVSIASDGWQGQNHWQIKHWISLQSCYGRSSFWDYYAPFFEELYTRKPWKWLVELNETILRYFLIALGLEVEIVRSSEYGFEGYKSDLVLDHCKKLGAKICVLGKHGHDYLVEEDFFQNGVSIYYQQYVHPEYPQRFGNFVPFLSTVDLLFNCGPESPDIIRFGNIMKPDLVAVVQKANQACLIDLNP